jgi:hypothetical protein
MFKVSEIWQLFYTYTYNRFPFEITTFLVLTKIHIAITSQLWTLVISPLAQLCNFTKFSPKNLAKIML